MRTRQRLVVCLLTASLWLSTGAFACAARLITATVHLDGGKVLHSIYQDDGFAEAATVWRYLGKKPLWVVNGSQVKADGAEPLQAKLRGALVIRLQHVDRLIVEAKADELTLIRADPASDEWFLPAEEVERLAQAGGIADVPARTFFERPSIWLGLIGGIALAVLSMCAWLWIRARRSHAANKAT